MGEVSKTGSSRDGYVMRCLTFMQPNNFRIASMVGRSSRNSQMAAERSAFRSPRPLDGEPATTPVGAAETLNSGSAARKPLSPSRPDQRDQCDQCDQSDQCLNGLSSVLFIDEKVWLTSRWLPSSARTARITSFIDALSPRRQYLTAATAEGVPKGWEGGRR